MADGHTMIVAGCREQQPGHKLAGRGRVHRHLASGKASASVDGQRHPVAVDARAEGPQRVKQRAERTFTHVRVAVEYQVAVGKRGQRRGEPGDGAGVATVDQSALGRP